VGRQFRHAQELNQEAIPEARGEVTKSKPILIAPKPEMDGKREYRGHHPNLNFLISVAQNKVKNSLLDDVSPERYILQ